MKRKSLYVVVIVIAFLVFVPTTSMAQRKEISQAKEWLKKNQNLDKAQQSMEKLLKDSANRENEKIWLLLFDAVKKQYEQVNERLYLKQKQDTSQLFTHTLKMFQVLESMDSLDMQPNKKGEVKPKYRKEHAQYLNVLRPNLYNGGLFFIRKKDFAQAYRLLEAYIDCGRQPLFSAYNYNEKDKRLPAASYWAVYCGYKNHDTKATLRHTYLALKDTVHYNLMLQYLAETYLLEKDTARYVGSLEEGFRHSPKFPYFFPRLINYYSSTKQWDRALALTDSALAIDPKSQVFLFARSSVLLNTGHYKECLAICDTLFAMNDSLNGTYLNAGLAWFNRAVGVNKKYNTKKSDREKMQSYYAKALPYLEEYRKRCPNNQDEWALPLYTIYLNLNKGKEFDEIDQLIRNRNKQKTK